MLRPNTEAEVFVQFHSEAVLAKPREQFEAASVLARRGMIQQRPGVLNTAHIVERWLKLGSARLPAGVGYTNAKRGTRRGTCMHAKTAAKHWNWSAGVGSVAPGRGRYQSWGKLRRYK